MPPRRNRNTIEGDGYYVLGIDTDGDGSFDTARSFYRLLGDLNGDHTVSDADADLVLAAYNPSKPSNPEFDVNGDGKVNGADRTFITRSFGRSLSANLHLVD